MKKEWKEVTNYFSEEARHYNGKYLLKSIVLEDVIELQLYEVLEGDFEADYEIFIAAGKYYGSIYTNEPYEIYDEIKQAIYKESFNKNKYQKRFFKKLREKYGLGLYSDAFVSMEF